MLYIMDGKNPALSPVNLKDKKTVIKILSQISDDLGFDEFVKCVMNVAEKEGKDWIDLVLDAE